MVEGSGLDVIGLSLIEYMVGNIFLRCEPVVDNSYLLFQSFNEIFLNSIFRNVIVGELNIIGRDMFFDFDRVSAMVFPGMLSWPLTQTREIE
jgi:hypothetical protein